MLNLLFVFLLVLLLFLICFSIGDDDIPGYTQYWFTQNLNHFDSQDNRTFEQRYLIYDKYWDEKNYGPIFFYAGNEGDITGFWNNTGFMFDIAPLFKALIIFAEHRYYGESWPFGIESFTSKNMQYLTMELAIADYAVLLTTLKNEWNVHLSPIVVFGGSYGGVLASLCRIHYPAIFDIALAASAPVPQTLNLINGTIFFQLVTNDYFNANSQCPNIVRSGYSQIINLGQQQDYEQITKIFNLCSQLQSDYDVEYLQLWIRNALLTMAMVDYPYSADFMGNLPAWPVNVACNILLQNENNPIDGLAQASGFFYNDSSNNDLTCYNITAEFIECADQTGCGLGTDATAWDYQMCTEIVYAMDTNNITDMFPPRLWNLNNLTDYCIETYNVIPNPTWMQIYFPADVQDAGSYIIWSNGLIDPWHGGGYLYNLSSTMPAVIIPSGAHHLDLRSSNPQDPNDVIQARNTEVYYIQTWLDQIIKNKYNNNYHYQPLQLKKIV